MTYTNIIVVKIREGEVELYFKNSFKYFHKTSFDMR